MTILYSVKVTLIKCLNYYMNTMRLSALGLVVGLGAFSITPDYLKIVISAICSVTIGLVLRLAYDWGKGKLTVKQVIIQAVFSMGTGYMTFFWLEGGGYIGMKRQFVLCIVSFLASYIISALDVVGAKESKGFIQNMFNKLGGVFTLLGTKKDKDKPLKK